MREFSKNDYRQYHQWFIDRALHPPKQEHLPPTGFIIDGVAAGFLIKTDAHMAILDYYATNPKADSKSRHEALEEITSELIVLASKMKFKAIKVGTCFEDIKERAIKHGFRNLGEYTVLIRGV